MKFKNQKETDLLAISPLDGRYAEKTHEVRSIFSEFGLMKYRVRVEISWLITLSKCIDIVEIPPFSTQALEYLDSIANCFSLADAKEIKALESKTNHDVKAVEYFLKAKLSEHPETTTVSEFVHFACTSEDINNLAYALMLILVRKQVVLPALEQIIKQLEHLAGLYSEEPMLARTHGQFASPTTVGKELANVVARLRTGYIKFENIQIFGKCNGAVGNFNAHAVAYPNVDWLTLSQTFVEDFGLSYQEMTTQIEPHDGISEFCHSLLRLNTVLLDLNRDFWTYISLDYFRQRVVKDEVGSSTMPHKVNPIDFENSEGNIGIANAILGHLAEKLPVSRLQRDLSDSTALRNLGVGIGYSVIAYQKTLLGLNRVDLNRSALISDLERSWEVLSEAIQTTMRRYGVDEPYEQLKKMTRGNKQITAEMLHNFIQQLPIPDEARERLLQLSPTNYIGYASQLTQNSLSKH